VTRGGGGGGGGGVWPKGTPSKERGKGAGNLAKRRSKRDKAMVVRRGLDRCKKEWRERERMRAQEKKEDQLRSDGDPKDTIKKQGARSLKRCRAKEADWTREMGTGADDEGRPSWTKAYGNKELP